MANKKQMDTSTKSARDVIKSALKLEFALLDSMSQSKTLSWMVVIGLVLSVGFIMLLSNG